MLQYFLNRGIKIRTYIFILLNTLAISQSVPYFDEHRAFDYLVMQCDMGPRYPGSDAHNKLKNYFIK